MLQLSFHGAAGEVTGSCTLVETQRARILVDFGMHQGGVNAEVRNRRATLKQLVSEQRLDSVVLTHAHIDHSGRLPMLPKWGYAGAIHATPASCDLTDMLLKDSAHIQESDFERANRYRERQGRVPVPPLYDAADVARLQPLMRPLPYEEWREIADGVRIRFFDAGHILGSASVEMRVRNGSEETVVVFSGDLGPKGVPLMRDPTPPPPADVVILESTYGDHDHRPLRETVEEFEKIISASVWNKERVFIPAFAVGRTQQLLYHLSCIAHSGRVPVFPVYVDSPMAITATELYKRHRGLFDAETQAIIDKGDGLLELPGLEFTRTSEESRRLNNQWGAGVIIAASGMCTGGRILHHLRHNLWKRGAHVIVVGYQAQGSLGRRLVEGAERVRVLGEPIIVRAQIHTLGGFSAHAGHSDLLGWPAPMKGTRPRVFLNHGESAPRSVLAAGLRDRYGWKAAMPEYQSRFEI